VLRSLNPVELLRQKCKASRESEANDYGGILLYQKEHWNGSQWSRLPARLDGLEGHIPSLVFNFLMQGLDHL
jgi:hypothetical protein